MLVTSQGKPGRGGRAGSPTGGFALLGEGILNPVVTLTRASANRTYYDSSTVMQTAGTDVARFDHDPVTGVAIGLRVEGARTNLYTDSDTFDSGGWTATRSSVTADQLAVADGTSNGDLHIEDSSTNTHVLRDTVVVTSGVAYTSSVYFAAKERTWGTISDNFGSIGVRGVFFDLTNGVKGTVGSGITSSWILATPISGLYRCAISIDSQSTTWQGDHVIGSADTVISYAGDGASGLYLWRGVLELGTFPGNPIVSSGGAGVGAADVVTFATADVSPSMADGSAVTYAGKCRTPLGYDTAAGSKQVVFSNDDGTANNYETLYRDENGDMIFEYHADGDAATYTINGGAVGDDEDFSWSVLSDTNNFALVIDGWPPQTNLLGTRPTVDTGRIGADVAGNHFFGTISEYEVF